MTEEKLPIIGKDYQIVLKLAHQIHRLLEREYEHTDLYESWPDRRGWYFDVRLADGRVARITVDLDRVEQ